MEAQSGASRGGGRLILSDAGSPVERKLIERWAVAEAGPQPADVIDLHSSDLPARLAEGRNGVADDSLLVPVRITWLPKERDGRRDVGWADLLRLRNPRRPGRYRQSRIVERDAGRYRVVVGEPARASELRRRFLQHSQPGQPQQPGQPHQAGQAARQTSVRR